MFQLSIFCKNDTFGVLRDTVIYVTVQFVIYVVLIKLLINQVCVI